MAIDFRRGKLGGGGYVVDIDISPDGLTRVIRTDVYGAYIWEPLVGASGEWVQVINPNSMPASDNILGFNGTVFGCYAIRVAPSNSNILYAVFPGRTGLSSITTVYKSTDRAATWVKTTLTPMLMTIEDDHRMFGPKMAIHPTDPDIVLVTNNAGDLWRTADGGTNWTEITVPSGEDPVVQFNLSDPTIAYIGWRTGDNRLYRSTDTGATFAQMTGGPDNLRRITCGTNGKVYMTGFGVTGNVWRLVGTTFTNLTMSDNTRQYHAVAVSPVNPDRVTVGFSAGNIDTSLDGGDTWGGMYANAAIRSATGDVTWLAWTLEDSMSSGNIAYDPDDEDLLWFVEGIGVWYTTPPLDNARPTWNAQTRGNDELIIDDIVFPPGGYPILSTQDRGVFRITDPTTYPATHGPGRTVSLQHSWSLDYASSDPNFICVPSIGGPGSYYSTDGGVNWTAFASQPAAVQGFGGSMAALTPLNIVWFPNMNKFPQYTTDGGATWSVCTFPVGVPTSGESGWGFDRYTNNRPCAADRVNSTFYAVNYITDDIYQSTDGGANWTSVSTDTGFTFLGGSSRLLSVPGQAGHIFMTGGQTGGAVSHPYNIPMKRSTDGGVTVTEVSNTQEVWCIGFGKAAPGQSYPTIMIAGYANGDSLPGIYTSIDNCVTWVLQSNAPAGTLDHPRAIAGDMNTNMKFFIGLAGSGFVYSPGTMTGTCFGLQF